MSAKSVFKMGFLSMIAATGLFAASNGFAADARRVDVIGTLHETVAQLDSVKTEGKSMRVDVIGTIHEKEGNVSEGPVYLALDQLSQNHGLEKEGNVSEGPVYPYTKPMSH